MEHVKETPDVSGDCTPLADVQDIDAPTMSTTRIQWQHIPRNDTIQNIASSFHLDSIEQPSGEARELVRNGGRDCSTCP